MKAATQGRQAGLVRARRRTSSTANVCRVSGQAAERRAATASRSSTATGATETRSMVYTEYFVKGTQPDDVLPAASRRRRSWIGSPGCSAADSHERRVAAGPGRPAAGRAGTTGAPRRPAPCAELAEARATEADGRGAPKKKRGFWSRVFGRARTRTRRRTEREARRRPLATADEGSSRAQPRPIGHDTIRPVRRMPFRDITGHRRLLELLARASRAGRCRRA